VAGGGRVLVVHARKPEFIEAPVGATFADVKGYVRIRAPQEFPSLKQTTILMLDGPFTEMKVAEPAELTLIPPSMFGPPEFIHMDIRETHTPALLWREEGRVAWVPWNLGALYYRLSLPAHAGLFRDLLNRMLPKGRQLETDAHPLVEMALMQQPGRILLHLINLSGHSQTAYFAPLSTAPIKLRLDGSFKSARMLRSGERPVLKQADGRTEMVLSELRDYELVVLEK
jgi:hypothetical protein